MSYYSLQYTDANDYKCFRGKRKEVLIYLFKMLAAPTGAYLQIYF